MDNKKNVFIISYKTEILDIIDGNMPKMQWVPAFAGMTIHVGGSSH